MKTILKFLTVAILLPFGSCVIEDCSEISCTTPPSVLFFTISNVEVENIAIHKNGKEAFVIERIDEQYVCNDIGWDLGVENNSYELVVNGKKYPFIYHTENITEECCTLLGELKEFSSSSFDIYDSGSAYQLTLK